MKLYFFKLFLFLIIFVLVGLFREYVFININNIIYFKYYKNTTVPIPFGFVWLTKLSYTYLYYLKYPLTILFVLIYYFLNYFFLKIFAHKLFYIRVLQVVYIVVFITSAFLMLYSYFIHKKLDTDEYHFSRGLMGLVQSPLISFVLFALYLWDKNKLYPHEKRN